MNNAFEVSGGALETPDFLRGGGEMGALMRRHDWSTSLLGPPRGWPQPLRTMVRLLLNTGHPMYIWWGPQLACLYNDAYRQSIGPERHPGSLGRPAREVWAEVWPIIGPQIEQVMTGQGATWHVDQLVPITRHGRLDDVYWTYSYSPIDDESAPGGIGGVLVVCRETTEQVLAARQLKVERDRFARLFELAPIFMALLEGPEHKIMIVNPAYQRLVGRGDVVGRTVAEALPEAVAQGYLDELDRVFATGDAYNASGAKYERQGEREGTTEERFVDVVYQPIKSSSGKVTGIFVVGADVSERMNALDSLRQSEGRFRAALKAGRMGHWETDHTSKTRTWSEEGMKLFGLELLDGKGKLGGPNDEFVSALHPEDRHLVPKFHELAERQESFPADYRVVRPDGRTLWLSGRGAVTARTPDGKPQRLISIMADVTEAKLAEEMLRLERERLRLAFSAAQMGAFELDLRAGTLWWSPETYEVFGVSETEFAATPESVIDLVHPDDRARFVRKRSEAIAQRMPFLDEFRINRPGGREAWIAYRGRAEYDLSGQPVRTFGIIMDITERKRAEEVLRDADREKDNFIATLSHELRNPMAPIHNALTVLRQLGTTEPRAAWCLDVLGRQTALMTHLLDDLLDVSRLTRGQLKLRLRRLELATAIDQAIETAQPFIDARGHRMSVTVGPGTLPIEGDLTRLAQVFSNVLINAAKYTPPEGRIALTAVRQGAIAVVTVRDSGIGIARESLEGIFQMFGQVEAARDLAQGGQGIGLALAQNLVILHGGSMEARSEGLGKGSEFEIRLPLADVN
jgi:PAS domain S-box-containing protein